MKERHLSVVVLSVLIALLVSLPRARAENHYITDITGELVFSDGEVFEYRVLSGGVIAIYEGADSVHVVQHQIDRRSDAVSLRGITAVLDSNKQSSLSIQPRRGSFYVHRQGSPAPAEDVSFWLKITGSLIHAEGRSASEVELTSSSSICCVSCGPRTVCATEVSTFCGSCADNQF